MLENAGKFFQDFISTYILGMRPNDFVDIAIVAYVVYKLIKLIRETRAEQLIKGIVMLIVITQVSEKLNLNVISFILKNAMQFGFIALLIVFQPELRRALEKMGRSRFGNVFNFDDVNSEAAINKTIDELCKSVEVLSKERIGALIVIERKTKIGDIIRTGITLDAKVSSELLINIFVPRTPLHDGAVIIRDNEIKAATCYLPLTQNDNLSKELGTRHRAAIGISENSDCVVIVVSEETGKISVALGGDLTRNLTIDTLRKALMKTLQINKSKKNKNKKKKVLLWRRKSK